MKLNEIIEIITGIITAISTAATATFSIYRFFKRKEKVKQEKAKLLKDLCNLYDELAKIKDYKVYLKDSDNVATLAYYVLAYRNYLSYEECILLQRRIHEFEAIDEVSFVTKLAPTVSDFLSDVKRMIDSRTK